MISARTISALCERGHRTGRISRGIHAAKGVTTPLHRRAGMAPVGGAWLRQIGEEAEIVAQVGRREEILAHYLAAALAHLARAGRIAHQFQHALGALFDARHQIARLAILNLQRNAADIAADDWAALPQPLRDGQAEALAERLLQHDRRHALEGVHLDIADAVHVREQVDIGIAVGVVLRALVVFHALRVVMGHRADQHQLHIREALTHDAVDINHAERVFPGIEARNLYEYRALWVNPVEADDARGVFIAHRGV